MGKVTKQSKNNNKLDGFGVEVVAIDNSLTKYANPNLYFTEKYLEAKAFLAKHGRPSYKQLMQLAIEDDRKHRSKAA